MIARILSVSVAGHQLPELFELDFAASILVDLIHGCVQVLVAEVGRDLVQQAFQGGTRDEAVALQFQSFEV